MLDWVSSKLARTGATNCGTQSDKIFLGVQFEHMVVLPFKMGGKGGAVAQGVIWQMSTLEDIFWSSVRTHKWLSGFPANFVCELLANANVDTLNQVNPSRIPSGGTIGKLLESPTTRAWWGLIFLGFLMYSRFLWSVQIITGEVDTSNQFIHWSIFTANSSRRTHFLLVNAV